jgi:RNA polymerase sigma-70 factor (ECF subfamily)
MFTNRRKKYRLMTDEELVNIYKDEKSSLCIEILYERYGHLVMGVSLKYLKKEIDAEDLCMKIFEDLQLKLINHSVLFFKSWLYMVVKNECFMILRKSKKETLVEFIENYDVSSEDELEKINNKEINFNLLEMSLENLKGDQKKCIQLFYLEEKSYNEISELLNLPLTKVKSAIQNGKRNIKIILEQNDEFKKNQ